MLVTRKILLRTFADADKCGIFFLVSWEKMFYQILRKLTRIRNRNQRKFHSEMCAADRSNLKHEPEWEYIETYTTQRCMCTTEKVI